MLFKQRTVFKMSISFIICKLFSFWLFAIKILKTLKLPVNTEFILASSLVRAWLSEKLSHITMGSIFCLFFFFPLFS